MLDDVGPADDITLIVARLHPTPLHQRLPAVADQLAVLRRAVRAWAVAAALPGELTGDLQLALGEAVANAVEHAYAGRGPGEFTYHLQQRGDGSVHVEVHDDGCWRPVRADPGNRVRGRGLNMISNLARNVIVDPAGPVTRVRFTVPAPPLTSAPPRTSAATRLDPPLLVRPAELRVHRDPGGTLRLQLCGELDLATIGPLRDALLDHLRSSDG